MQAYTDPSRESDPFSLPDLEVFYQSPEDFATAESGTWQEIAMLDAAANDSVALDNAPPRIYAAYAKSLSGWYYWSCLPGCLPDSDPVGPFETESLALADAREFLDYDDETDETEE